MTGWRKQPIGDLPLYQAKTMAWLPRVVQGFTTRKGGVSAGPYESLNLGAHVGDDLAQVQANRRRVWHDLGISEANVALAEQVHGDKVAVVTEGSGAVPVAGADALVSNTPNLLLMLFFADCVPVYLVDPVRKAAGLAHAGWRGTAANIAGENAGDNDAGVRLRSLRLLCGDWAVHRRRQLRSRAGSRRPVPVPARRTGGKRRHAAL